MLKIILWTVAALAAYFGFDWFLTHRYTRYYYRQLEAARKGIKLKEPRFRFCLPFFWNEKKEDREQF